MRDTYHYSAQKLADEYRTSKGVIGQMWQIASLPESFARANDLSARHLYELSKLVDRAALVILPMLESEAKARQAINLQKNISSKSELIHYSEIGNKGKSTEQAGSILGVSDRYIYEAKS